MRRTSMFGLVESLFLYLDHDVYIVGEGMRQANHVENDMIWYDIEEMRQANHVEKSVACRTNRSYIIHHTSVACMTNRSNRCTVMAYLFKVWATCQNICFTHLHTPPYDTSI